MLARMLLVMSLVLGSGELFNALLAQPELGRQKYEIIPMVTLDPQGNPVIGGELNLIVDDRKHEATLLRVKVKDGDKITYPYLVYPKSEGSKPALLLKEKVDENDSNFGFHWRREDEMREVGLDVGTVRIASSFYPAHGPLSEHVLSSNSSKQLILRAKADKSETGGFIGVIRGYDNRKNAK